MIPTSIWDFLDAKTIIIAALGLILAWFYFDNKNLKSELEIINLKNLHLESEQKSAKLEIVKQNEALKNLQISTEKAQTKDLESLAKLEKIESEFKTCEGELKAFKELFSVLNSANKAKK